MKGAEGGNNDGSRGWSTIRSRDIPEIRRKFIDLHSSMCEKKDVMRSKTGLSSACGSGSGSGSVEGGLGGLRWWRWWKWFVYSDWRRRRRK